MNAQIDAEDSGQIVRRMGAEIVEADGQKVAQEREYP